MKVSPSILLPCPTYVISCLSPLCIFLSLFYFPFLHISSFPPSIFPSSFLLLLSHTLSSYLPFSIVAFPFISILAFIPPSSFAFLSTSPFPLFSLLVASPPSILTYFFLISSFLSSDLSLVLSLVPNLPLISLPLPLSLFLSVVALLTRSHLPTYLPTYLPLAITFVVYPDL